MESEIRKSITESIQTKQSILNNPKLIQLLSKSVNAIINTFKNGGTFFAAGNGGSASDAQHMVAEFVGRFYYDRAPLRAFALNTNSSNLTCLGNDYGYDSIFSRQLEAYSKKGDIFLAISTSGNSKNIIKAVEAAKDLGVTTIGLTGERGGRLLEFCDWTLQAPSSDTARIQESHIMLCHVICEMVEAELFPKIKL